MSADDRIEMDEDMAEFWAEVKERLPDTLEFCPGGRPTGLSSESEDAIKALLGRVEKSLE